MINGARGRGDGVGGSEFSYAHVHARKHPTHPPRPVCWRVHEGVGRVRCACAAHVLFVLSSALFHQRGALQYDSARVLCLNPNP